MIGFTWNYLSQREGERKSSLLRPNENENENEMVRRELVDMRLRSALRRTTYPLPEGVPDRGEASNSKHRAPLEKDESKADAAITTLL